MSLTRNTTAVVVAGNTITGPLSCNGNDRPPDNRAPSTLGGSDPYIILDTNDVEGAAKPAWATRMENVGQGRGHYPYKAWVAIRARRLG